MAIIPQDVEDYLPTPPGYATPEQLSYARDYAKYLQMGAGQQPVKHWTQGVSNMVSALVGGLGAHSADALQRAALSRAASQALPTIPETQAYNSPNMPSPTASVGGAPVVAGSDAMAPYKAANDRLEAGGKYTAIGPTTRAGDNAYGRYQVMGANIPAWTKKHVGREMTPQEFLADPAAQDKVYEGEFGGYLKKYGNAADAASMWFTGKPAAQGANRSDATPTTKGMKGSDYVKTYVDALRKAGGNPGSPVQMASLNGAPTPDTQNVVAALNPQAAPAAAPRSAACSATRTRGAA